MLFNNMRRVKEKYWLMPIEYFKKKKKSKEMNTTVKKTLCNENPYFIAIASGKGGVGKTTIAANLGAALAKLGNKVILMDMDLAMPNLEIITGVKNPPVGLVDALEGRLDIYHIGYSGPLDIKVIPPGIMLDGYSKVNTEKIKKLLDDFPLKSNFVIFDMPPGREAIDVLNSEIRALLVVNPNKPAVLDALNMKVLLEKKGVKILGVILNRAKREDEVWIDETERILETSVVSVIPESRVVEESLNYEECFVVEAPKSEPSKEIMALAKELMREG